MLLAVKYAAAYIFHTHNSASVFATPGAGSVGFGRGRHG